MALQIMFFPRSGTQAVTRSNDARSPGTRELLAEALAVRSNFFRMLTRAFPLFLFIHALLHWRLNHPGHKITVNKGPLFLFIRALLYRRLNHPGHKITVNKGPLFLFIRALLYRGAS